MIFTLSILINLLLIFAVWRVDRKKTKVVENVQFRFFKNKKLQGQVDKYLISAKIAEKMAERAFNLASSANLGVIALQKSLAMPRLATKEQLKANEFASNKVDKLFSNGGTFDWLRPILSEEELDILDKAQEMNGAEHKE